MSNKSPVQQLEEQKHRLAQLKERHTRVQVKLEAEKQALAEAQAEAQVLFGTSELDGLREMYRHRSEENERLVTEFIAALDEVERRLSDVERQAQVA